MGLDELKWLWSVLRDDFVEVVRDFDDRVRMDFDMGWLRLCTTEWLVNDDLRVW